MKTADTGVNRPVVSRTYNKHGFFIIRWKLPGKVKWAVTQEVSVEGQCGDTVSVALQHVEQLALKTQRLELFSCLVAESLKAKPHPVRI